MKNVLLFLLLAAAVAGFLYLLPSAIDYELNNYPTANGLDRSAIITTK